MKLAKDFRASAGAALKGKWGTAVIAGVIASIFGINGGASFDFEINDDQVTVGNADISELVEEYLPFIIGIAGVALVFGILFALAWSAVASTVNLGYCRFNLEMIDGKPASIGAMFSYFPHILKAFASEFLRNLYTFLWMLLFIIPGIIAAYNYAMVPYIIADDTTVSVTEALRKSKELMYGNRRRLFCLEISFIGWYLLSALTFGIGALWVNPYRAAAVADFYREISGTRPVTESENDGDFAEFAEQTVQF